MKNKILISITIIFFLIVNTNYFWKAKLGSSAFSVFSLLFLIYLVLGILLFRQIYFALLENFINKQRLITIGILTIVMLLSFLKPNGLINFDRLQGNDLLIAEREGAANCSTTLKLNENGEFRELNVCFGATEITGNYELKNDTIFFKNVELGRDVDEYYMFAIIKPSKFNHNKKSYELVRFKSFKDTIGHELSIIKNELKKQKA